MMFPELEQRRNEAWDAWRRLFESCPQDPTAIRILHDAATQADREWADAYARSRPITKPAAHGDSAQGV